MTSRPEGTLVVHTGGIGDLLLACPSIEGLGLEGPVELLGRQNRLELAVAGGIATAAHQLEKVEFETVFDRPSEKLGKFLAPFKRVVVWMADDDGRIRQGLEQCGVGRIDVHSGLPPKDWDRHASVYYLERLGMPEAPAIRLRIEPAETAYDVIIHPGSGSATKNWPLQCFVELAQSLESLGRAVTWCLGPAELEAGTDEFERVLGGTRRIETESLVELAGHLAAARHFIGNDSGITHLAASLGCPTVALFGPTRREVWAPQGSRALTFEEANLNAVLNLLRES